MRIRGANDKERLDFFEDLYQNAKNNNDILEKMDINYAQYKGSREIDGSDEEATVVRNITYELIESQVSSYIPTPAITPRVVSEARVRLAKSIETLCKNKRDELGFEQMNDIDERYSPIYGGSIWLVEWDNSIETATTSGDVKVSCLSPKNFVGEPHIYNVEDMDYCFISFESTKDDLVRKYGISYEDTEETESTNNGSAEDNSATVIVCYYKNENDEVCQFIWSGEKVLADVDDFFSRQDKVCKECGKREGACECEGSKRRFRSKKLEYEPLDKPIVRSDGTIIPLMSQVIEDGQPVYDIETREARDAQGNMMFDDAAGVMMPSTVQVQVPRLEETKIPYYKPTRIPIVIRKNTSQEDSLFGQSDCEFIRPQQQAINKVESRIMMKLMRSSVTPVMPEDATVAANNAIFGNVIRMRQGQSASQYGVVDTTPNIAQDIAEAERLYDHAKRILGISDSFQGQYDGSAQSGRAKQLQIQQAAGRLESKRQMKNAAYADIDKIIFQLTLAFADEPRDYSYKDSFGRWQNISFNRYDFLEQDDAGEWFYNDEFMFAADASFDIDKNREFIWQENLKNFQIGAYGIPQTAEAQLIYWQNLEATKYPFAHDNVERLKDVIMAQRQAAMAQQQLAALGAENEALSNELTNRTNYGEWLHSEINKMTGGA